MLVSQQLGWNWPYGAALLVAFFCAGCLGWAVIAWRPLAFDWWHQTTNIILVTRHKFLFNGFVIAVTLMTMIVIAFVSNPPEPYLAKPETQKPIEGELIQPEIKTIDKTITDNPDGTHKNTRLVEIMSRCSPGWTRFIVRGKNIIFLTIRKTNQPMMITGEGGRIGDSVFLEVADAWGKYMVIVTTRNADDVIFDYSCK